MCNLYLQLFIFNKYFIVLFIFYLILISIGFYPFIVNKNIIISIIFYILTPMNCATIIIFITFSLIFNSHQLIVKFSENSFFLTCTLFKQYKMLHNMSISNIHMIYGKFSSLINKIYSDIFCM